jgi:hypothetical protein
MIQNDLQDTIENLISEIFTASVPADMREDFDAGIVSLVDVADLDTIAYYNELAKLRLLNRGIIAAQKIDPDSIESPVQDEIYTPSGSAVSVINEDDFADQGFEKPVSSVRYAYKYHSICQGDTLRSIALLFYGDSNLWHRIAAANDISENDLIDNDCAGTIIKIPVLAEEGLQRGDDNLVYETTYDPTSVPSIQQYLYGTDLKLRDKKFQIDGHGDLAVVKGLECVIENIKDRMNGKKGALIPHPEWGLTPLSGFTGVPYVVRIEQFCNDLEQQAMLDPRVSTAYVNRKTLSVIGDSIWVTLTIELIGGYSETIKVQL